MGDTEKKPPDFSSAEMSDLWQLPNYFYKNLLTRLSVTRIPISCFDDYEYFLSWKGRQREGENAVGVYTCRVKDNLNAHKGK